VPPARALLTILADWQRWMVGLVAPGVASLGSEGRGQREAVAVRASAARNKHINLTNLTHRSTN
jgi:hypothetical protein